MLPPGWLAVTRDGSVLAGDLVTWLRPDGRGLHLRGDADRLAEDLAAAEATAAAAAASHDTAQAAIAEARRASTTLATPSRTRPWRGAAAEETERGAIARGRIRRP